MILKTVPERWRLLIRSVRLYKKFEAFGSHFQRNVGFNKKSEILSKITRLFEDIFNANNAFLK
jgi:hypothetical protein